MKSALTVALLLLLAVPLAAQDRNIQITVLASQADFQGENDFDDLGFETDFEEGAGLGGTINWFLNPYVSIEGSAFGIRGDASLIFEEQAVFDLGKLNLTMFGAGAQLHLLGQRRIDPYVGAGGAYVIGDDFVTSDLEAGGVGRIELENEFTYYVNAGIGLQISEGFGLVLDARYLPYETSSRSSVTGFEEELEIAPRIYSAGVRLRF